MAAGDDTATELPIGFDFPFQGASHSSVFVNSNGNLTFGAGDTDFGETVAEFLAGPPRIAPLWDDLNASFGLVVAEQNALATTVHYVSVPEFFSDVANYFSVRIDRFGIVKLQYGPTARSDSLVGVTEGGGAADPGESDLSRRFPPIFSGRGTTYEQFAGSGEPPLEPFDLDFDELLFLPFF